MMMRFPLDNMVIPLDSRIRIFRSFSCCFCDYCSLGFCTYNYLAEVHRITEFGKSHQSFLRAW